MGPIGWPEIVVLLFLLVVPAALITGIVLIVTGGPRKSGPGGGRGEMTCGGCGYQVRGLEQLHCPECGADLRAVGIAPAASSGKRTLGIVLVVVSGLLLVSCCGVMAFGMMALRSTTSHQWNTVTAPPSPQGPGGSPFDAVEDEADDAAEPIEDDLERAE